MAAVVVVGMVLVILVLIIIILFLFFLLLLLLLLQLFVKRHGKKHSHRFYRDIGSRRAFEDLKTIFFSFSVR